MPIEFGKPALRLDHEPAPAAQVEPERHVVGDGCPAPMST
jgi:hypothetical protein